VKFLAIALPTILLMSTKWSNAALFEPFLTQPWSCLASIAGTVDFPGRIA